MVRQITQQRCFKIPKDNLDLFLCKLTQETIRGGTASFEAEFIFENGPHYDVVVNTYGNCDYAEVAVEDFAEKLLG